MNTYTKQLWLIIISAFMLACGGPSKQNVSMNKYTVHAEAVHKTLHFTGTIQPIQEYTLISPIDAVVQTIYYHYGQHVKKSQAVFTLNSSELQKQYNETLTEYLKAKDSYSIARAKFIGTEDLWKEGLISKNNYLSEKSSLNTSRITLMQTTRRLSEMLEKMGEGTYKDLSRLNFSEFDKIRLALTGKHNLIQLKSPSNGLVLYPPKASEDKSIRVSVGASTKAGQVLAMIGDLSGIRIEIDIPEVDIEKIKPGMPAIIRGMAFSKQVLHGTLLEVNSQASNTNGTALPSFTAVVEVKDLTPEQQNFIKVGMSASVELAIDSANKLLVPIAAIQQKGGQNVVSLLTSQGKTTEQPVITGTAYADKAEIDTGLKEGDIVMYPLEQRSS